MIKRNKPVIGDSIKLQGTILVVEELFVADLVRWVRCSKLRKRGKVTYNGSTHNYYEVENIYLPEFEVIKAKSRI